MAIRVLQARDGEEIKEALRRLEVDPYGIKIMAPKAGVFLFYLAGVSRFAANILKQEALSCGGDAALPRKALTGKGKKTDCILIASPAQLGRLKEKLLLQPFGLNNLSRELPAVLDNYLKEEFKLDLGRFKLEPGKKPLVMGIINITPDSFSSDGLYGKGAGAAAGRALELCGDGADILDLGGESTRPGVKPVSLKEELKRVIPALKKIARTVKVPVSVDTYKPEVARQALDNGALIINDISGLRDPAMAKVCARYKAAVVVMHMQGRPLSMQKNPVYTSLMTDIIGRLAGSMETAAAAGIDREKIIIDPGIGFGKTVRHNLEILKNLKELKVLGSPILIGTSRKKFIGEILNAETGERLPGTIASCVLAYANGANIFRVHDVKQIKQALKLSSAALNRISYD